MGNHNQMCASVFIILVSAVLYSAAESQQIDQYNAINVIAWTGENVNLHCRNNRSEYIRYWKRGEEILTIAYNVWTRNPRIEPLNNSITLRINNVSVDDQGEYTCIVSSQPIHRLTLNLQVKDFTCDPPEKPLNGDYKEDSNNSYTFNDRIHYFCNRGFELVGSAIRTCSGPPNGWTPDEPFCEPDYIVRLQKSVAIIGNKITSMDIRLTSLEIKTTSTDNRMTTVENRMTTMENCSLKLSSGERNGHNVLEFEWVIEDFNGKVPEERENDHILYSRICRQFHEYKFSLLLRITFTKSYDIDLVLYPTQYDNLLEWPFNTSFNITILNKGGYETRYKSFSGHQPSCPVDQPSERTIFTCYTYSRPMDSMDEFMQHILPDNTMVIKLYLNQ